MKGSLLRHARKVTLSRSRSRSHGVVSHRPVQRTLFTPSLPFASQTCSLNSCTNTRPTIQSSTAAACSLSLRRTASSAPDLRPRSRSDTECPMSRSNMECPRSSRQIRDLSPPRSRSSSSVAEVSSMEARADENVKPFSSIPGPGGLHKVPYFGTGLLFKPFGKYPVEKIDKTWAELHDTYGPIVRVRVGGEWLVMLEDLQDAQLVLQPKDPFPYRPPVQPDKVYFKREDPSVETLGSTNGEEWRRLRSPLNARMNRPSSTGHYLSSQEAVADDLTRWLYRLQHQDPRDMQQLFFRYAAESIGVVSFNKRIGFLDDDAEPEVKEYTEKLLQCYRTIIQSIGQATFGKQWLFHFYKDSFYRTYKEARDYTLRRSSQFIEDAMQEVERKQREGTLDKDEPNFLLSLLDEKSLKFIDVVIMCDALMTAGSDSTACGLQLLFHALATNPDKQEKLAAEILGELGPEGSLTHDGLSGMPYLKAAVKEAMRLHFPIPTGATRKLPHDIVLRGYNIPQGISIQTSSNRIAKSPRYYDQPDRYLPERWLRGEGGQREKSIHSLAFLPFGFGPRNCIGRRFAEQELHLATLKVVQKYKIGLQDNYGTLDTAFNPFCAPVRPLPLTFTPRH